MMIWKKLWIEPGLSGRERFKGLRVNFQILNIFKFYLKVAT